MGGTIIGDKLGTGDRSTIAGMFAGMFAFACIRIWRGTTSQKPD